MKTVSDHRKAGRAGKTSDLLAGAGGKTSCILELADDWGGPGKKSAGHHHGSYGTAEIWEEGAGSISLQKI